MGGTESPDTPDGMFHKATGFISHVHPEQSPLKTTGKRRDLILNRIKRFRSDQS